MDSFVYLSVDYKNIRKTEWVDRLNVTFNQSYILFLDPSGEELARLEGEHEIDVIEEQMESAVGGVEQFLERQMAYIMTIRGAEEKAGDEDFAQLIRQAISDETETEGQGTESAVYFPGLYDEAAWVVINNQIQLEENKSLRNRFKDARDRLEPFRSTVVAEGFHHDVIRLLQHIRTHNQARQRLDQVLSCIEGVDNWSSEEIHEWWLENSSRLRWDAEADSYVWKNGA
ncbi:MAG: hypothetical protein AAF456_16640 [Planctomycetota bacterium]